MPYGKPLVLVVDDDAGLLRLMNRTLELEGYQVITAPDGIFLGNPFPSSMKKGIGLLPVIGTDGINEALNSRFNPRLPGSFPSISPDLKFRAVFATISTLGTNVELPVGTFRSPAHSMDMAVSAPQR